MGRTYCGACGAVVRENHSYCRKCGARIVRASPPPPENKEPPPVVHVHERKEGLFLQSMNIGCGGCIIIVAIFIIIIAMGMGG